MESGQILHMREMYRKWMLQVKGSYREQIQDRDHTDGHYITLFAEQLTRTFEVLVARVSRFTLIFWLRFGTSDGELHVNV